MYREFPYERYTRSIRETRSEIDTLGFALAPQAEAELGQRQANAREALREYVGYIRLLQPGQAGWIEASEGESDTAVKRRLGRAAKLPDESLVNRRAGRGDFILVG